MIRWRGKDRWDEPAAAADAAALAIQAPGALGEPLHSPRARRVLSGLGCYQATVAMWPGNTQQHLVTYVMKSARKIDHRQRCCHRWCDAVTRICLAPVAMDLFGDAIFRPRPFNSVFSFKSCVCLGPIKCHVNSKLLDAPNMNATFANQI